MDWIVSILIFLIVVWVLIAFKIDSKKTKNSLLQKISTITVNIFIITMLVTLSIGAIIIIHEFIG